jgi:leucyl aminopeptidase
MKITTHSLIYSCCILFIIFSYSCKKEDIQKDDRVAACINELSADTIKSYVQWMQDKHTRFFLSDNRKQIATEIKNKFIQLGYLNTRIDSFYLSADWNGTTYNTWQYNVIARLEGNYDPGKIYVLGSHWDCVVDEGDPFAESPGANDNASGVASIIEIARVLKKLSFTPKYTIEFVAFAAEENDLNGSGDYAKKASDNGVDIVMMLNNDMIAYEPGSDPSSWNLNVMHYRNSNSLRSLFVQYGELYTELNFTHRISDREEGDSFSFYNEGYEALFIISDAEDTYYHTTGDIASNYNFNYCREVTAVSCALLVQENMN